MTERSLAPYERGGLSVLPVDADQAVLLGRIWDPTTGGPRPVVVRGHQLVDAFSLGETTNTILELDDPATALRDLRPQRTWDLEQMLGQARPGPNDPRLLAPIDLQVIKACGVTHRTSLIERVIEQLARGDASRVPVATEDAQALTAVLETVVPGSAEATRVKEDLIARGIPPQYLEVGLGPHPEVFTKAPVLSAMGPGERIGVPSFSTWNNPEPELVLICNSNGAVVGATLGNDVNLRDIEGRSALLLGMAKDNNASCAVGPFIRLFDDLFDINSVRNCQVSLRIEGGDDDFLLQGESDMREISRDPLDL